MNSQHIFSSKLSKLRFLYHMFFKKSLNNLYLWQKPLLMRNVLYICLDICNKLCYTMKCVVFHLLMEADLIKVNLINAFYNLLHHHMFSGRMLKIIQIIWKTPKLYIFLANASNSKHKWREVARVCNHNCTEAHKMKVTLHVVWLPAIECVVVVNYDKARMERSN